MRVLMMLALVGCEGGGILEPDTDADTAADADTADVDTADVDTSDADTTETDTETDTEVVTSTVDYSQPGTLPLTEANGSLSLTNCALTYTTYTPAGGASAPLVVLGHGFSRSATNMADVARHIASHGLRVVTPNYCFSSIFGTDHPRNGQDAAALSAALAGGSDVVHIGYSAGGLSAVVAAQQDPATVGVFGLDLTDTDSIAADAASTLSVPVFGVVGDGSACNSNNNGTAVYTSASDSVAVRIPGATHCDFEGPTGIACTLACGGESAEPKVVARAMAAAFAAWVTDVDPGAQAWLLPGGAAFDDYVDDGTIVPL